MIQLVETCFLQSPLKPRVLPKEAAHEITTLSHLQAVLMCGRRDPASSWPGIYFP